MKSPRKFNPVVDLKRRFTSSEENTENQEESKRHTSSTRPNKRPQRNKKNDSSFRKWGIGVLIFILFLGAGIWGGYSYYQQNTQFVPAKGGTLNEGLVGQPRHINPLYASKNNVDRDISRLIYPSLFTYKKDNTITGELVKNSTHSEDRKTYTVTLKSGFTWDDGKEITAEDVLFTLRTIQDPKTKSPLRKQLQGVTMEKQSKYEITFNLPSGYAPFKSRLTFGILPEHVWGNISRDDFKTAVPNLKPVGAGPYTFDSLQRSEDRIDTYTLIRNSNYFKEKPKIKRITFDFYQNRDSLVQAFEQGTVDTMLPQTPLSQTQANFREHVLPTSQYFALFFNTQNTVVENDVIRNALRLAINKDKLVNKHIGKRGQTLNGPLTSINTFHTKQTSQQPSLKDAQKILEENGWNITDGGNTRKKEDQSATFEIVYSKGGGIEPLLKSIQQKASQIGISITLTKVPFSELRKSYVKSKDYDYDALFAGQALEIYPDPYVYWHSSQIEETGLNLSQYSVIEVDKFLETARTNDKQDVITNSLTQFQSKIREDVPAIFTHSRNRLYYSHDRIKNMSVLNGADASARFRTINQWYITEKRVWK